VSPRPRLALATLAGGLLAAITPAAALADPEPAPLDVSPFPPLAPPADRGPQLGVRLGYALPTGRLGAGTGSFSTYLSDLETATVPIGLDAGYRFTRRVYVGGTLSWGPGVPANRTNPCQSSGVHCSRLDAQLRSELRYYFAPDATVGGWFAVGIGWEVAAFAQTVGTTTTTSTLTGPIVPDLQLGFDVRGGSIAIGPYLGVTFAEFTTYGQDPSSPPVSMWLDPRAVHTWITLGVRGSYGPW
jgi:hypothetical protein